LFLGNLHSARCHAKILQDPFFTLTMTPAAGVTRDGVLCIGVVLENIFLFFLGGSFYGQV
jgi:hypothetical protein